MRSYSIEFRREVLADCDAGMGTMAVALKRKVSESWVRRLKQRRKLGEIGPRPPVKKTPPTWKAYEDKLRQWVEAQPDITLAELRAKLGIKVSLQTLSNALRALRYTVKKKSSTRVSKTARTSL
jgi:transposase